MYDGRLSLLLTIVLLNVVLKTEQTSYPCNASASCGCSTNSATLTRIVGGEDAASQTWGWAVRISIANSYLCGGAIISSSWVITAAHCMSGFKASQVRVYAGSLYQSSYSQTSLASCVVVHPSYNTRTYRNDLALIKLATPLTLSDPGVSQICLPTVNSATLAAGEWPSAGSTVVAVGWGRLSENGSLPSVLQQVTLQTIAYNSGTCSSVLNDRTVQLCADDTGKDTCQGDSGGPLMMFLNNLWVLVGVTSYGIGCARPSYAGVYTRVAAFQDWISSTTSAQYCDSISAYQLSSTALLLFSLGTVLLKRF